MAEKSIILTIGSIFSDDGFKKAKAAITDMNKSVRTGARAASALSSSMAQLDTSASKATTAVGGVVSAFVAGGVAAGVLAIGITVINAYVDKLKREADELLQRYEKLKAAADKAFSAALTSQISAVNSEVKNLAADFDSITKQANAFAAAIEGVRAAGAQGGILRLQTEKLQKMIDAHTDAERQTIEAEYNIKIAAQKRIEAEESGAQRIAAASDALAENEKRVANIDAQLAKITEERQHLEEALLIEKASSGKNTAKLESEIAKLKQTELDLERKRNDTAANNEVLDFQLQKVKQEAVNATEAATQGLMSAQLAQKRLSEAQHAHKVAEEAAKDAAEVDAAAKLEDAKEVKTAAQIQADANKAARDLAAAQREYADAINNWIDGGGLAFDAIQQSLGKGNKSWTKAGVLDAATQQALAGQVGAFAVDQALAGGAKTVRDLQRAEREGQRRGRDALSADSGQMTREAKRYERLAKQDRDKLSKSDKDFMDKFEKLRNANNEEKKKIADREANIKELATNAKELRKTADEIAKKLDKLGLK